MEKISLHQRRLKDVLFDKEQFNVPEFARVTYVNFVPRFENRKPIEGSLNRIELHCVNAKTDELLLNPVDQDGVKIVPFLVEYIADEAQMKSWKVSDLKDRIIDLTNSKVALRWQKGKDMNSGYWGGFKVKIFDLKFSNK